MSLINFEKAERARDRLEHYGELADTSLGCQQIQLVLLAQLIETLESINRAILSK